MMFRVPNGGTKCGRSLCFTKEDGRGISGGGDGSGGCLGGFDGGAKAEGRRQCPMASL